MILITLLMLAQPNAADVIEAPVEETTAPPEAEGDAAAAAMEAATHGCIPASECDDIPPAEAVSDHNSGGWPRSETVDFEREFAIGMAASQQAITRWIACTGERMTRFPLRNSETPTNIATALADGCSEQSNDLQYAIVAQYQRMGLDTTAANATYEDIRSSLIRMLAVEIVEQRAGVRH